MKMISKLFIITLIISFNAYAVERNIDVFRYHNPDVGTYLVMISYDDVELGEHRSTIEENIKKLVNSDGEILKEKLAKKLTIKELSSFNLKIEDIKNVPLYKVEE